MIEEQRPNPNGGKPDPTIRTWEALDREVRHLREQFATQIAGQDVRINAIEKASEVFQEGLTRVPTQVQQEIAHLKEFHEAKFAGVEKQFTERDTRTEQTSAARRAAVEAAIKTASDAVEKQNAANQLAISKSEAAFTKQIDQIGTQIDTAKRAQDTQIGDIKDRLTMIEGRGSGYSASWGYLVGGAGLIVAMIVIVQNLPR